MGDLLRDSPEHPRCREAQAISTLLEEVKQAREETAQAKGDVEALKAQLAALQARLDEKEQELKRINEILLQKKP